MLPYSCNMVMRETFNIQKWNNVNQRFEPVNYFGYEYSPGMKILRFYNSVMTMGKSLQPT